MKLFNKKDSKAEEAAPASPASGASGATAASTSPVAATTTTAASGNGSSGTSSEPPSVPSKTKTPSLPSKEKKPPPQVPTTKDKKPAPVIPTKKDKSHSDKDSSHQNESELTGAVAPAASNHDDSTESDDGKDHKESSSHSAHKSRPKSGANNNNSSSSSGANKRNTLNENETLKVKLADAEDKLEKARKENADLAKQLKKAKSEATPPSDNDQAGQLLSILARVNSAAAWSVRVKALEPLLAHLATVKQYESGAASVVAAKQHVDSMLAFDDKSKATERDDASKALLPDAEAIVKRFADNAKLTEKDRATHLELLDKVAAALDEVAKETTVPSAIPPQAISKVYTDFAAYKQSFEATVVPSHAKIAKIIADLIATLDESAKMNAIVEEADGQFSELFVNTKFYVEDRRARQPDPEYAGLQTHYDAQLAALHSAAKQKVAASESAKEHDRLTEEIKEVRKKLRAKERELEDLRDDGALTDEQKRLDDINGARAALAELLRRDEEAARIAAGGSQVAAPPAGPLELARRKLDASYTYEPLAAGVLKGSLHGSDSKCVLKVTQVPPDAALAQELELLGRLKHANLSAVGAAFVDGPHLYVEMPFYERGNLEQWLTNQKPDAAIIHRVMFNVLSGLAYMHDRGSVHGALRAEAILIDGNDRAVINSFWSKPSSDRSADEYAAPELASGAIKEANTASDVYSFGLLVVRSMGAWPARKSPSDPVSIPRVKEKNLNSLWLAVFEQDASKRLPALKLLTHAYFASQFANIEAILNTNKGLRSVRSALVQVGQKQKLMSDAEIDEGLAPLRDSWLFAAPGDLVLPVVTDDAAALAKFEAVGKALLHAALRQRPTVARLAPSLLKYILGALPTSVRDLLRDMDAFDASRARHYRHVRLIDDVCQLSRKLADGTPVTNTNREAYLKEALSAELVDSRKAALEKLRSGFFSISGVKDEVRKLKTSELAILIAGDEYLSGELVLARTVVAPPTANVDAFNTSVRALASDDLRRLLYAATGVATLTPTTAITVAVTTSEKHAVSFLPLFSRIDLVVGTTGIVEDALGDALTAIDAPLK